MKFFRSHKDVEFTDEELLHQYKLTQNSEFFGQLYNRYIPLIYGLCLKYLQDEDKAQDAVMEVFEDLLPKISNYEVTVFKTWLYTVVKNHCFRLLRKNKREVLVDFDSHLVESESIFTLFDEAKEDDKESALNKCLENLPEPQKIAVSKFFFEEMSYADIVDQTGYNIKSVKSYIQNGKRNLKICIERSVRE